MPDLTDIDEDDLDSLKGVSWSTLFQIFKVRVKGVSSGGRIRAYCPFHADTRPSLVAWPTSDSGDPGFHCFGCDVGGSAVSFVSYATGDCLWHYEDVLEPLQGVLAWYRENASRLWPTPPGHPELPLDATTSEGYTPGGGRDVSVPLMAKAGCVLGPPDLVRPVPLKAGPILRWVGGKSGHLDRITPHLSVGRAILVEPFTGSASVAIEMLCRGLVQRAVIGDANPDLVNLYRVIQTPHDILWQQFVHTYAVLVRYADRYGHDKIYNVVRAHFNTLGFDWIHLRIDRAACFLWLNRTGFNGLCRYSGNGHYNVPVGSFSKAPSYPMLGDLHALRGVLRGRVAIVYGGYRETLAYALDRAAPSDIVAYFDPPYVPWPDQASPGFTGYTSPWTLATHQDCADAARDLGHRGAHVVVSNHGPEVTRALYPETSWEISGIWSRRNTVSSGERASITEAIYTCRGSPP